MFNQNTIHWIPCAVILCCVFLCVLPAVAEDSDYTPHTFGPSYTEIALEHMTKGDYKTATEYLTKWLEANPRDHQSWYNLACSHAKMDETSDALTAFDKAVDAGWNDADHSEKDPDLASLQTEPRFKAAVQRIRSSLAERKIPGVERRFLPMTSMWTYLAVLPPDYHRTEKQYPVCLILHGHGSTEMNHGRLSDRFGRDDVIYVCPRAPYPFLPIMFYSQEESYTAWPPKQWPVDPEGDNGMNNAIITQYVNWILACAEDVKADYRCRDDHFYIIGHSQGAWYANFVALMHPEKIRSYAAFAGGEPDPFHNVKYYKNLKKHNVKPYLIHCTDDPVVPVDGSRSVAALMKDAGVDVQFKEFPGDHQFNEQVVSFIQKWLKSEVLSP